MLCKRLLYVFAMSVETQFGARVDVDLARDHTISSQSEC